MNTGLWKMDSGLAAAPRPGMTVQGGECRQLDQCARAWFSRSRSSLPVLKNGTCFSATSTGLFLVVGLLVGLALTATDRGAENVAEAGAGFGGAEFLHCPLLLIHFARLDRQRNAPGGAVDRGDLGIDPLADREAVGALLAAVARQFGFADKTGHAVGQRHLDAAFLDRADRRGHDIALLDAGDTGFERIHLELLDAERDALFLGVQ